MEHPHPTTSNVCTERVHRSRLSTTYIITNTGEKEDRNHSDGVKILHSTAVVDKWERAELLEI